MFSIYSFFRYILLLIIGLFGFDLIYLILTPITSYSSFFLIKLVYSSAFIENLTQIVVNNDKIILVKACIAGAAYYFLLCLNLVTPMSLKTRIKSLIFLFGVFLIANILRIFIFSYLYLEGYSFFNFAHLAFWYFGSTIFVVILWFVNVKLFKINNIPVYSDFKSLVKQIKK